MRYLHTSGMPSGFGFSPILERAGSSICCPDCQSDEIRRSKTRGTVESLLVLLRIRPYRCEECDYRFFRWSIRSKPKATKPERTTNAPGCELLTPCEASHGATLRKLKWVEEQCFHGWRCSECTWVFNASGPPSGHSLYEMMENYRQLRDEEFADHICVEKPRRKLIKV